RRLLQVRPGAVPLRGCEADRARDRPMTPRVLWFSAIAIVLCATTAFADDAADLKRRGDEAMDAGHAGEALDAYVRAAALSHDPALSYNKGRAHWALGHYGPALEELRAFERDAPPEL